jgi:hypothetical protein
VEVSVIDDKWLPTASNVNALPEGVREYVHDLETNADPAGMVRENALLTDQLRCQNALLEELSNKLQWLVDNWYAPLEDGGITFPDGDFVEKRTPLRYPSADHQANEVTDRQGKVVDPKTIL